MTTKKRYVNNTIAMRRLPTTFKLYLLVLIFCQSSVTWSFGSALLIGVSDYQSTEIPSLPGIDQDLFRMQNVARTLGVKDSAITILPNENATKQNILKELSKLEKSSANSKGPIIIYFSGHGSNIDDIDGDEQTDGLDEVLLPYDTVVDHQNQNLLNTIVDDELNEILSRFPSERLLVIIDACHSGTATRSLKPDNRPFVKKTFVWREKLAPARSFPIETSEFNDYLTFSAARDHEQSLSREEGSVFTYYLEHHLVKASLTTSPLNYNKLIRDITHSIDRLFKDSPMEMFRPVLTGPRAFAVAVSDLIPPTRFPASSSKLLDSLLKAAGNNDQTTSILQSSNVLKSTQLKLDVEQYCLFLHVNPMDEVTLLNGKTTHFLPGVYKLYEILDKNIITEPERALTQIVLLSSEKKANLLPLIQMARYQKQIRSELVRLEKAVKENTIRLTANKLILLNGVNSDIFARNHTKETAMNEI